MVTKSNTFSETRLNPIEMAAWRAWLRAHAVITRALDDALKSEVGISLADYEVLIHLSEAPQGRLRMSDLADLLLLSRSGTTRRVATLISAGWVMKATCPSDGRGAEAVLTKAGRGKLMRAAPTHFRSVRRSFIDPLAAHELKTLGEISQRLQTEPE